MVALEGRENDVTFEDRSVQLYAPVTSAAQTIQTDTNSHYLSEFQQFCIPCKVCSSSYVEAGTIHRHRWSGQSDLLVDVLGIKFLSVGASVTLNNASDYRANVLLSGYIGLTNGLSDYQANGLTN